MNNCLVTIQNISKDDIRLIILRKDANGNKFPTFLDSNILKSGKIKKYDEKMLNWKQIRKLQSENDVYVTYSPIAEDVLETTRFDLLDFE